VTIELAGEYRGSGVDRLLEDLEAAVPGPDGRVGAIDLSRLRFVTPTALAVLGAAFEVLSRRGAAPSIVLPADDACRRYVQRMDVLPTTWRTEPESFGRRPPTTFCPMHRFSDDSDYPVARRALTAAVERMCDLDDATRDALALCLDELCENVVHHARGAAPAVAVAHAWPARGKLQVAIADAGRGVLASLRDNADYADLSDDLEAVRAAFTLGVTATPDRNSGMGLSFARHLVAPNGGTVGVRSGFAAVTRGAQDADQLRGRHMAGTLVVLVIKTDLPLDIRRAYAEMDEGNEQP
jgi:anti-sigma regulatory factor (Ser/Thr protein kinase)